MSRPRETPPTACHTRGDVPGCDTGLLGRWGFVLRELAGLWRDRTDAGAGSARKGRDPR